MQEGRPSTLLSQALKGRELDLSTYERAIGICVGYKEVEAIFVGIYFCHQNLSTKLEVLFGIKDRNSITTKVDKQVTRI